MGLYSRIFCTRGELDPARQGSPLVPSPVSCKRASLYQLNTIPLNLSQGESYTPQHPVFPGCHVSERRVSGLSLASWHLLRGRLRVLCSFPGSFISLGLSCWHCFCEVTFPQPDFLFRFPPAPHHPLGCTVWFMVWLLSTADQWLGDTLIALPCFTFLYTLYKACRSRNPQASSARDHKTYEQLYPWAEELKRSS